MKTPRHRGAPPGVGRKLGQKRRRGKNQNRRCPEESQTVRFPWAKLRLFQVSMSGFQLIFSPGSGGRERNAAADPIARHRDPSTTGRSEAVRMKMWPARPDLPTR